MRLCRTLRECGYEQGITDPQIWRKFNPLAERGSASGKSEEAAGAEGASGSGPVCGYPRKVQCPDDTASAGCLLVYIISTHADDTKGSGTKQERDTVRAALRTDYDNDAKPE